MLNVLDITCDVWFIIIAFCVPFNDIKTLFSLLCACKKTRLLALKYLEENSASVIKKAETSVYKHFTNFISIWRRGVGFDKYAFSESILLFFGLEYPDEFHIIGELRNLSGYDSCCPICLGSDIIHNNSKEMFECFCCELRSYEKTFKFTRGCFMMDNIPKELDNFYSTPYYNSNGKTGWVAQTKNFLNGNIMKPNLIIWVDNFSVRPFKPFDKTIIESFYLEIGELMNICGFNNNLYLFLEKKGLIKKKME